MAARLANAFVETHAGIADGSITPEGVAREVGDFTPEYQLARIYENHRALQRRRFGRNAVVAA
jgi:hypothetical protein